ncbi:MAG: TonB-dependent receptor, partial [Bacteroidota bacterium]
GVETIFGLLRFNDDDGTPSTSEVIPLDASAVEPERGYKFINEFQTYKNGNSHNLTFYTHFIDNYVFDRPLGVFGGVRGPNTAFFFDQADALFLGFDYTWKSEWTDKVSGILGISYLWSRNIGDNEPLINQPPISTSFELQWNQGKLWFLDSSRISLRPSYTFEQYQAPRTISPQSLADGSAVITADSEIFDFADPPEGYFLLDLTWNLGRKNINASISANNLLNTSYRNYLNDLRYYADEPGRNILFTLNYAFKNKK